MTATCTKCRARQLPGERWTRNGNGWLCESHSPNPQPVVEVYKDKDKDEDEDYVKDYSPPKCSPSPSPSKQEDDESLVEWLLRAHDAGDVQPVPLELPPLPTTAWPSAKKVAEFYRRVWGLRELSPDLRGEPVMFGCEWVAKHVGLTKMGVSKALKQLVVAGVLRPAKVNLLVREGEEAKRKGKRPINYYLPGGGS